VRRALSATWVVIRRSARRYNHQSEPTIYQPKESAALVRSWDKERFGDRGQDATEIVRTEFLKCARVWRIRRFKGRIATDRIARHAGESLGDWEHARDEADVSLVSRVRENNTSQSPEDFISVSRNLCHCQQTNSAVLERTIRLSARRCGGCSLNSEPLAAALAFLLRNTDRSTAMNLRKRRRNDVDTSQARRRSSDQRAGFHELTYRTIPFPQTRVASAASAWCFRAMKPALN